MRFVLSVSLIVSTLFATGCGPTQEDRYATALEIYESECRIFEEIKKDMNDLDAEVTATLAPIRYDEKLNETAEYRKLRSEVDADLRDREARLATQKLKIIEARKRMESLQPK